MAHRKDGILTKLKKASIPRRLIFFDTETYIHDFGDWQDLPFRLGVATYVKLDNNLQEKYHEQITFRNPTQFVGFISKHLHNKSMLYVFAHNIGFDIRVLNLPRQFKYRGWISEPPIINNLLFLWRVKTNRGSLQFIDTSNLGVRSVSQLGETLGFPKGEVDFNTPNERLLETYCKRDVDILEHYVTEHLRFLQRNELGGFRMTIASQSLATYRYKFMRHEIRIHNNPAVLELEDKAYHGGRTECFFIGKPLGKEFYYLDINSMYPYVMKHYPVPTKFVSERFHPSIYELERNKDKYFQIARVLVTTDEPAYAVFDGLRLIFPIGTFWTILVGDELREAIELGRVLECQMVARYESNYIFGEYVDFFNELKVQYSEQGNNVYRTIVKLFLNSLYGKFGQLENHREMQGEYEGIDIFRMTGYSETLNRNYQIMGWYGKVYYEYASGETEHSNRAIASTITANARRLLYSYIKRAGKQNVYYCDTDSLLVNREGYRNLIQHIDNHRLGQLKIEDKSNHLVIHNPKDYEFGNTIKLKGKRKDAIELGNDIWAQTQFQGFLNWLNSGGIGNPKTYTIQKTRRSGYKKGVVQPSGYVTPHHIEPRSEEFFTIRNFLYRMK